MEIPTRRLKLNGTIEDLELNGVWQADPLHFEVGIFLDASTPETDFANVSSFALMISRDRREQTVVASQTVAKAAMDAASFTLAQWDGGTHQHVTFALDSADMNFPLVDADERLWWSVVVTLTSGDIVTAGGGYIEVRESGTVGAPSTAGGDVYSIVTDSGGIEWLQISRAGMPDKYVQLFNSIP